MIENYGAVNGLDNYLSREHDEAAIMNLNPDRYQNDVTGLVSSLNRFQNGVWTLVNPNDQLEQGNNLYAYAEGNPVGAVDPDGVGMPTTGEPGAFYR